MRRLLESQTVELKLSQTENLFCAKCKVFKNTCSMILDSSFKCDCCSYILVDKLTLTTTLIHKPYKLQWIKGDSRIVVKEQVTIPISIGIMKNFCDIVLTEARHILLGRPCQYC